MTNTKEDDPYFRANNVNAVALVEVWNHIAAHPELHDQGSWAELLLKPVHELVSATGELYDEEPSVGRGRHLQEWLVEAKRPEIKCGTAGCIAGWTTILHGDKVIVALPSWEEYQYSDDERETVDSVITREDGQKISIERRAADLLGINTMTAATLFQSENTRFMLRKMILDLLNTGEIVDSYEDDDRERRVQRVLKNEEAVSREDAEELVYYEDDDKDDDRKTVYPPITFDRNTGQFV